MEINLDFFFQNIKTAGHELLSHVKKWVRQLCVYRLGGTRFISFEGIVLDRKWFCATQEEGVYSILTPHYYLPAESGWRYSD